MIYKRKGLLVALAVALPVCTAAAQEQFRAVQTMVICKSSISGEQMRASYQALFPKLFAAVEKYRSDGVVTDVYFMPAIGEGVVFFASMKGGDSQSNADMVIAKLKELRANADTEITPLTCDRPLSAQKSANKRGRKCPGWT